MSIKYAGIALVVGAVLSYVSAMLFPGNALINPVDQTDFAAAVNAIAVAPTSTDLLLTPPMPSSSLHCLERVPY